MKQIEKENGQIFEVFTSRSEFSSMVKFLDWSNDGEWEDESSLTLVYKDGTTVNYQYGDKKQPLRLSEVVKGCYNNPATYMIYNCEIIYNEYYEDWEVKL